MDPIKRADKIRSALHARGLSFLDVDRHFGIPERSAWNATREPNPRGEAALAETLAVEPQKLWPERYDASGQRLSPQPLENYQRPPSMRQRRKLARS